METIDPEKLRTAALRLKTLLEKYSAADKEVADLAVSLARSISATLEGRVVRPMEFHEIPLSRAFSEGNLAMYEDLHDAYASYVVEATGGMDDEDDE
jgi:hypothetical protein